MKFIYDQEINKRCKEEVGACELIFGEEKKYNLKYKNHE